MTARSTATIHHHLVFVTRIRSPVAGGVDRRVRARSKCRADRCKSLLLLRFA
jgi:hypothetical protein